MKMTDLLRKARIENKEFLTAEDLRRYCKVSKFAYDSVVKYLVERKYLIRIFRGIFYVKTPDEIATGGTKYNHRELVAKGLELKGVKNWYFGLYTALKINNLTHEHYVIEDVLNDSILRSKPMAIAGYKFKFHKLSSELFTFGIKSEGNIKYSDIEKTILDFIYIWRYHGIPSEKIIADVSEWSEGISRNKMGNYSIKYPKSVRTVIKEMLR